MRRKNLLGVARRRRGAGGAAGSSRRRARVHQRAGGGERPTRFEQRLQAGEDHRPAAVELAVPFPASWSWVTVSRHESPTGSISQ